MNFFFCSRTIPAFGGRPWPCWRRNATSSPTSPPHPWPTPPSARDSTRGRRAPKVPPRQETASPQPAPCPRRDPPRPTRRTPDQSWLRARAFPPLLPMEATCTSQGPPLSQQSRIIRTSTITKARSWGRWRVPPRRITQLSVPCTRGIRTRPGPSILCRAPRTMEALRAIQLRLQTPGGTCIQQRGVGWIWAGLQECTPRWLLPITPRITPVWLILWHRTTYCLLDSISYRTLTNLCYLVHRA